MEEELRQTAISRHIQGGESPKDVYTSLNRSKKWFFQCLTRYRTGSPDWFKEQSRAPKTRPSEIDKESKDLILLTRQQLADAPYAQIGVSAIKRPRILLRQGADCYEPSCSAALSWKRHRRYFRVPDA